nr:glycosyltransferase family 39 protein [uncultured Allomuricauda sp.]
MVKNREKIPLAWLLASVSFVSIIIISFLKTSLELEDAEQAYYSQWWRLGYDDQPPLFTWIQKAINSIFGVTKFSLSFLRGTLFGAVILSFYGLAKRVLNDKARAEIVVLSSALIPVFIDFTFRRLSHTLLLCLMILLTLHVMAQLIERKSIRKYLLLGICFGLGMLCKYNYSIFLMMVLGASFFDASLKRIVWNPKILLSCTIAFLLFSPHFYWLIQGEYLSFIGKSISTKLETEGPGVFVLTPILELIKALLEILLPLLLVVGLFLVLKKVRWESKNVPKWLRNMGVIQIAVLVLFFIFMNVKEVQARWLVPLLLPYFIFLIGNLGLDNKKVRKWGMPLFLLILVFQVFRTPAERFLGITSDIHFDYTGLSDKLQTEYSNSVWVLPNVTYGGQIKLHNPKKELFTLDDFSIPESKKYDRPHVILSSLNRLSESLKPTDSLSQYGPDKEDLYFFEVYGTENLPFHSLSTNEN